VTFYIFNRRNYILTYSNNDFEKEKAHWFVYNIDGMEEIMNILLNLMVFVGFLGFLGTFALVMVPYSLKKGRQLKPLSILTFITATTILLVGTLTTRSNEPIPLEPVGVNQIQSEEHLRSLLRQSQETRNEFNGVASPGVTEDSTANNSSETDKDNSFVDTNSQVAGIKEGDVVKTDGNFIYYASRWDSRVRVMSVDNENLVTYVTTIDLATEDETIYTDSMYLTDDYLIIIGYRYSFTNSSCATKDENGDVYVCDDFVWWQPTGSVVMIDRDSLEIVYSLRTNAAFIDHRIVPLLDGENLIGETLYLVGHHYFYSYNEGQELRPYYIENDAEQLFMPFESMSYINEDNLYAMTTITGIPLVSDASQLTYETSGYLGTTPDYKKLFVNFEHLYLAQSNYIWQEPQSYQTTTILKFRINVLEGTLTLLAVGTIRGVAINQFALDEYEGFFRIATTDTVWDWRADEWWWTWDNRTITNRLYILRDLEDGTFEITSLIEEGLGKPNESIMSVRFQGQLAYIVTFLRTDPLYIIDLSNPNEPVIREEIVLPGFDTYQHPWGNDALIGLGYDANESGEITGMKLSAYQTTAGSSDVLQTINLSALILEEMPNQNDLSWGWTWAEALWDHKAITVSIDHGVFAFAINAYSYELVQVGGGNIADEGVDPSYNYEFTYHSYFFIFDINFENENPITLLEKIEHPSSDLGYVQVDRGVIINDVIHTLSNQQMISYDLSSNEERQRLTFPEYQ
jgi:inhibitor of cysteine peptidase